MSIVFIQIVSSPLLALSCATVWGCCTCRAAYVVLVELLSLRRSVESAQLLRMLNLYFLMASPGLAIGLHN